MVPLSPSPVDANEYPIPRWEISGYESHTQHSMAIAVQEARVFILLGVRVGYAISHFAANQNQRICEG